MFTKNDFPKHDGLYYVGNVVDVDGDGWVDEEQIELIIKELNAGVSDDESLIIFRPDLAYVPFTQNDKINFIHLN